MFLKHLEEITAEFHGKRLSARLKPEERQILADLAAGFAAIPDADERMLGVNRAFLDKPKPKNWTIISEILTMAASRTWHHSRQQ